MIRPIAALFEGKPPDARADDCLVPHREGSPLSFLPVAALDTPFWQVVSEVLCTTSAVCTALRASLLIKPLRRVRTSIVVICPQDRLHLLTSTTTEGSCAHFPGLQT